MDVLFVLPVYKPAWGGGVLTAMAPICNHLKSNGHNVTVYASNDDGKGGTLDRPTGESTTVDGVEVKYFDYKLPKNIWSKKLHNSLKSDINDVDIVHISGMYKLTYESVRRICCAYDTEYIYTPHGTLSPESIRANNRLPKLALINTLARPFLRDAAAIHYTSPNEKTKVESVIGTASDVRSVVIPNGIDLNHYSSGNKNYDKLGIQEDSLTVLFVGRLVPNKGVHIAIEAVSKLDCEQPRIIIVGPEENTEYETELRELAHSKSVNVDFRGEVSESDLLDYYACCDVLVLPSKEENFGMVVAEAAAAGTPSVVTPGVDIHPLIEQYNAGRVVDRRVPSVRSGIDSVSDGNLDDNARELARSEFSIEQVTQKITELYKSASSRS